MLCALSRDPIRETAKAIAAASGLNGGVLSPASEIIEKDGGVFDADCPPNNPPRLCVIQTQVTRISTVGQIDFYDFRVGRAQLIHEHRFDNLSIPEPDARWPLSFD